MKDFGKRLDFSGNSSGRRRQDIHNNNRVGTGECGDIHFKQFFG